MKILFLALLVTMVTLAAPAFAQQSYKDGYNSGMQSPVPTPPSGSSSDYYYGYSNAKDDAERDYQDQQSQRSYEPEETPQAIYSSGSSGSSGNNE